tara:strand:+ start:335 stop:544 length:210 start_codon:yes stop_codon:yes gene_type:complete
MNAAPPMNEDIIALEIVKELQQAIKNHNRVRIQNLYDQAQDLDWDSIPDTTFQEYNALVDQANDILLTT